MLNMLNILLYFKYNQILCIFYDSKKIPYCLIVLTYSNELHTRHSSKVKEII